MSWKCLPSPRHPYQNSEAQYLGLYSSITSHGITPFYWLSLATSYLCPFFYYSSTFSRLLSKISIFEKMLRWLFERTRRRGKIINRYERIGLALFVAIPLPVTGAWTGSLAAVLFGLNFKHAFLSIFIGVSIAGVIVTCATLLGWTIFGLWKT